MDNEGIKLILRKLESIEVSVSAIPVQSEKISKLESQISAMWEKHDKVFGIDGVVAELMTFQKTCPRKTLEKKVNKELNKQWVIIALLAVIVTGTLLKAIGVV